VFMPEPPEWLPLLASLLLALLLLLCFFWLCFFGFASSLHVLRFTSSGLLPPFDLRSAKKFSPLPRSRLSFGIVLSDCCSAFAMGSALLTGLLYSLSLLSLRSRWFHRLMTGAAWVALLLLFAYQEKPLVSLFLEFDQGQTILLQLIVSGIAVQSWKGIFGWSGSFTFTPLRGSPSIHEHKNCSVLGHNLIECVTRFSACRVL